MEDVRHIDSISFSIFGKGENTTENEMVRAMEILRRKRAIFPPGPQEAEKIGGMHQLTGTLRISIASIDRRLAATAYRSRFQQPRRLLGGRPSVVLDLRSSVYA